MTDDPLRTRYRPGDLQVDPHSATWDSTVFAIAVGSSVRYLEVPADQVGSFLTAVDAGQLDRELAALAVNPTGKTLDKPGRVRAIAAFDRILRSAVARTERDTATGQLAEPGWQPRKRRHDDNQTSRGEQRTESPAQSTAGQADVSSIGAGTGGSAAVGAVAAGVARSAWWQSPVVAIGAVVAVVVVVAGTVFAVTRSSQEPASGAAAVSSSSVSVATDLTSGAGEPTDSTAVGTTGASSGTPTTAVSASPAVAPPVLVSPADASTAATSAPTAAEPTVSAVAAPGAPGDLNRFGGSYSFTRTVTETNGNENFAVGASETGTLTLTAACDEPSCAIDGGNFGSPVISGDQLAFAGTGDQACSGDPSITATVLFTVTLDASATGVVNGVEKVTAMQGVGTLTAEANGCPDTEIKPITFSYDVTRTG